MKKGIFNKLGILFILIFSFVLSIVTTNDHIVAAGSIENVQKSVYINSVTRNGNNIIFNLDEALDVKSVTYEICYENTITGIYEGDLLIDQSVSKINDKTYSIKVDPSVIGVEIHEVRFVDTGVNHTPSKNTKGFPVWGNVNSERKKNYVEVTTDKLECVDFNNSWGVGLRWLPSTQSNNQNFKYCTFYFNLDTEIDEIINITFEYAITHIVKEWIWSESYQYSETQNPIEMDSESLGWNIDVLKTLSSEQFGDLTKAADEYIKEEDYAGFKNYLLSSNLLVPSIGAVTSGNGYDWYLAPEGYFSVYSESSWWGNVYHYQTIDEVSLIKMSYWSSGNYFENIPVLDEDTGWTKYTPEETIFDKITNFFSSITSWIIVGIILILLIIIIKLINFVLKFFRLDKTSREQRRLKKQLNQLTHITGKLIDSQTNNINNMTNKRLDKKIKKNKYNGTKSNYQNHYRS